jgi:hypothetical protein
VFEHRKRQFPLGADLGLKVPWDEELVVERDRRYPRVSLEEVKSLAPTLVLLPDEPYEFSAGDIPWFQAALGPSTDVRLVSGKDLFWYGAWALDAHSRLRAALAP